MEKKLTWSSYWFIGSLLFGLFFGAGNLIFPIHLGQEAGSSLYIANLGFLLTGVGLPFLGVIAIALSKSSGVFDLASHISRRYAFVFTCLLYLTIGPFFALPRLATTSYEIGFAPFVSQQNQTSILAIFSVLFFLAVWLFARKPSQILAYVGKYLNPLFLLLLAILFFFAFSRPLGTVATAPINDTYIANPFFKGFTDGYNTLDALASLAFGIVIVSTIRNLGVKEPEAITKTMIKAGLISIVLMTLIYTSLTYMGTLSIGVFPTSANGGIALAQIAHYYLGDIGSFLLAAIVTVACLKTGIGLTTAFAETFHELFPKGTYNTYLASACILPCLFANVGLTKIIEFSLPVLMLLYPLAITLMLLAIGGAYFHYQPIVYQYTTYATLIAAGLDALNYVPETIKAQPFVAGLLDNANRVLPYFSVGLGWVVPALVGLFIGVLIASKHKSRSKLI